MILVGPGEVCVAGRNVAARNDLRQSRSIHRGWRGTVRRQVREVAGLCSGAIMLTLDPMTIATFSYRGYRYYGLPSGTPWRGARV